MTRLEYLTIIYAFKALCEEKKYDKLEELLDKVIAESKSGN